ncbi:MAG: TfoX/Sxy family transcriptional regulator of competence genes [Planctomycetota bacterium]|jgi:TfoX/Sxy family transcriptional regulator of competence genes
MGTAKEFIAAIVEGLYPLDVRARAMFGGHTIYCDEKVIALVCDDRFFLKPTTAADEVADRLEACPPYPGARDFLILDESFMWDRTQFRKLIQATADALPAPKPKRSKKAKAIRKKA